VNLSIWFENSKPPDYQTPMAGLINEGEGAWCRYPMYMYYNRDKRPVDMEEITSEMILLVNDESEEKDARAKGYDNILASMIANRVMVNWFWDLEDFSAKQLVVFAKEEFDVDLPVEADQMHLFNLVLKLTKHSPQNCNRVVLMAHTIKMNYEQTLEDFRKMVENGCSEIERQEFVA
jgi:hypothetical protein